MKKYSYPALSDKDYGWLRLGGPGLANCMFLAAKAYIHSRINGTTYIDPTWRKLSVGPWLRRERDKRVYNELFAHHGLTGIRKLLVIKRVLAKRESITTFSDLGNYFEDLAPHYEWVKEFFDMITKPKTIALVDEADLKDKVAVHVRLGDYLSELRVDISWYKAMIEKMLDVNPCQQFTLFSDGTEQELASLLQIPNVKRAFYGNAYADMYAISRCKMLIASDSTFSAWGAFLGQKPIIFCRRHFPSVYGGRIPEVVLKDADGLLEEFKKIIS